MLPQECLSSVSLNLRMISLETVFQIIFEPFQRLSCLADDIGTVNFSHFVILQKLKYQGKPKKWMDNNKNYQVNPPLNRENNHYVQPLLNMLEVQTLSSYFVWAHSDCFIMSIIVYRAHQCMHFRCEIVTLIVAKELFIKVTKPKSDISTVPNE